jgi:hypothetical protein
MAKMSVMDRMAKDPVCGMKVDIVVGLPGLEPGTSSSETKAYVIAVHSRSKNAANLHFFFL